MDNMEKILQKLSKSLKDTDTYIVGGYLRDKIIGKKPMDVDLVTFSHKDHITNLICTTLNAYPVVIGPVIKFPIKEDNFFLHIDLTVSDQENIYEDLKNRDFTCNSLALHIKFYPRMDKLISLETSISDIKAKRILVSDENSLLKDPIRILRAYYLIAKNQFHIPLDTRLKIIRSKNKLLSCKSERIKDEFWKILSTPAPSKVLYEMYLDKVLTLLIPTLEKMAKINQNNHHHTDVLNHSFNTLKFYEESLFHLFENFTYVHKLKQYAMANNEVLKLSCLLHDIGKAETYEVNDEGNVTFHRHEAVGQKPLKDFSRLLKLSNQEKSLLLTLCNEHMRPLYLYNGKNISLKSIYRFFNKNQGHSIGILLLSLCDFNATGLDKNNCHESTKYLSFIKELIEQFYTQTDKIVNVEPLLDGNEVMTLLNIPPSVKVREIKDLLISQQVIGTINTKEEAVAFIKSLK